MINLDNLRPGKSIRLYYHKGHPYNKLMHIRAIIDEDYVVFKFWTRSRKCWVYRIEHLYSFLLKNESGVLYSRYDKKVERFQ